jgi:hypothetical protein
MPQHSQIQNYEYSNVNVTGVGWDPSDAWYPPAQYQQHPRWSFSQSVAPSATYSYPVNPIADDEHEEEGVD